jgi:prophage maintenance system killer protein
MIDGYSNDCGDEMPVRYLELSDLFVMTEQLSGRPAADVQRLSRADLLEAALLRPSEELHGIERHPRLSEKAAALMAALLQLSATRREGRGLAWTAMREFLARNGSTWIGGLGPSPDTAAFIVDGLVSGELTVPVVADWLDKHLERAPLEVAA